MQINDCKVLVTGGAGFIGSELARQAANQVREMVIVDSLVNGRRENLCGVTRQGLRLHKQDIRHKEQMQRLLCGVDLVFHLACLGVRHSLHAPVENHAVNATATLELLQLCRQVGVKRFIYVSSSEVYGTARWAPMTEEHPTFPMTVYGASKLAGECYARAFNRTYGYPTVVVRPFNSYGPRCHHEGDSGEVIPKLLLRCMAGKPMVIFGDGKQTRDFTFVSDTASGILLAGFSDAAIGGTINLGQGAEISINDLADKVATVVGNEARPREHSEPRPGDVLRLHADSTKARQLLRFAPQVSLSEGLARLQAWYHSLDQTPEQLLQNETLRNWKPALGDCL